MTALFLAIHVILAVVLIGVILLQRSDGGALGGIGGGSDPFGGVMSGRASANLLTRTTAILAAAFMATSLLLALLASLERESTLPPIGNSILTDEPVVPSPAPAPPVGE